MSNPLADIDVATGDITDLVHELINGPVDATAGIAQGNAIAGPSYLLICTDGTYARPPRRNLCWRPSPAATDAARFEPVEQITAYTDDDWSRRLQGLE
jgi:hypothetical protein